MLQNMKIGKKFSLIISLVLFLGLVCVVVMTNYNMRASTKKSTQARLTEAVNARAEYTNEYFVTFKRYFLTFPSVLLPFCFYFDDGSLLSPVHSFYPDVS